jgi:hypothetical protein
MAIVGLQKINIIKLYQVIKKEPRHSKNAFSTVWSLVLNTLLSMLFPFKISTEQMNK